MNLRVVLGYDPGLVFESSEQIWAPHDLKGALDALAAAEDALNEGYYIAGALSYEFGVLLNGVPTTPSQPLLILGAFNRPISRDPTHRNSRFTIGAPLSRVTRSDHESRIRYLLGQIRDGAVYQVNYTLPFDVPLLGEPLDLFEFLAELAHVPYPAFLEHDDLSLVSLSPELFLRFNGTDIVTKPMKGTASLANVEELTNEKNRAEHVMIVDLLRNDFRKVCSDVDVPVLFDVERYPTFATMTSTITGRLSRCAFADIVRATFPCGSVTGAPKRAAMQHIARIEREPRGFYTGSIGYLSPQRYGWWNVAIRTLQFERGKPAGRFDTGGGIVSDSTPEGEWRELLLKSQFLEPACEDFAILETLRAGADDATIAAHLNRLTASAERLGWNLESKEVLLARVRAFDVLATPHLIRIRATRHDTTMRAEPITALEEPVPIFHTSLRVRSDDPMLRHKTSWRPIHDAAAREATERGCFDALLCNERGELTEGSRTNLFVQLEGTLYTPHLDCGVLPGVLRSRLIAEASVRERVLYPRDLNNAEMLYIGNSARGLLRAKLVATGHASYCADSE